MFDARNPGSPERYSHRELLNILARSDADTLSEIAQEILPGLEEIEVVESRTGLVMLPMRDTVKGTDFHLGEVLVAEAHIRTGGQVGYGMRAGRDLEAVMAMAVIDAAVALGRNAGRIGAFLAEQDAAQKAVDESRQRAVEATRVKMETF